MATYDDLVKWLNDYKSFRLIYSIRLKNTNSYMTGAMDGYSVSDDGVCARVRRNRGVSRNEFGLSSSGIKCIKTYNFGGGDTVVVEYENYTIELGITL